MKKYFIGLFIVLASLLMSINMVSAEEEESVTVTNVDGDVFDRFIENSQIDEIKVLDSFGEVVVDKVGSSIESYLSSGNYDKVLDLLKQHDLSLQYAKNTDISINNIGSTVRRDLHEYHLREDLSGNFTKEWTTIMDVRYRENSDGTFTALRDPNVEVVANFGAAFTSEVSLVNSGYSYLSNGKTLRFSSNYRMQAELGIPISIGGFTFPIGKTFDWGTIYSSGVIR